MLPLPRAPECVPAARWPARGLAGLGLRNARLHWPARFSCHGPPPWGPWQLNVNVRHTRNCRATVCNSHATPQPTQRVNASGLVGLCLVVTGTILSPTGVLGLALPCLFALGFGGMAACAASLARKPRWFGVVGLIIGSLCIAFWIAVLVISFAVVHFTAANLRLGVGEHAQIGMSAVALTEVTETQRSPSGAPPQAPCSQQFPVTFSLTRGAARTDTCSQQRPGGSPSSVTVPTASPGLPTTWTSSPSNATACSPCRRSRLRLRRRLLRRSPWCRRPPVLDDNA